MADKAATFLPPSEYGLKLRSVQSELGPNSTSDGARAYLDKERIYKDTPDNRAKHDVKPAR